jgi:hypothetical protein
MDLSLDRLQNELQGTKMYAYRKTWVKYLASTSVHLWNTSDHHSLTSHSEVRNMDTYKTSSAIHFTAINLLVIRIWITIDQHAISDLGTSTVVIIYKTITTFVHIFKIKSLYNQNYINPTQCIRHYRCLIHSCVSI